MWGGGGLVGVMAWGNGEGVEGGGGGGSRVMPPLGPATVLYQKIDQTSANKH